jgi:hypothetical protein
MASSFRRAQLRGSEEIFRPTDAEATGTATTAPRPVEPSAAARAEGRLVRLTDEEISQLADALQKLKFPTSGRPVKPSIADFEQIEELRQKLLAAL